MMNPSELSRADLNLLVLFETVMEEQHVGRAAERLNLTASAVSHGLKRLRAMLGDPLFLKTPRGVAPTQRALDLAPAVSDVLARIRHVLASSTPFDPATTERRFTIAAPDAVSAIFLPPLTQRLSAEAPGVRISIRQLLPRGDTGNPAVAWHETFAALDAREMDIAVMPFREAPARFFRRELFEEHFVVAMRKGHPYARRPGLDRYCKAQHLVVSHTGDPFGAVDAVLAAQGLSRRVVMTVPNFMYALAALAESDVIAALPERFVAMHGGRFGIVTTRPPVDLPTYRVTIVAPQVAMMDAGLAWFVEVLSRLRFPLRQVPH